MGIAVARVLAQHQPIRLFRHLQIARLLMFPAACQDLLVAQLYSGVFVNTSHISSSRQFSRKRLVQIVGVNPLQVVP